MQYNHRLQPYAECPFADSLDNGFYKIQEGAFSVVIMDPNVKYTGGRLAPPGEEVVVKITSCVPSSKMLEQLNLHKKHISGLPKVEKCWGAVATDADDFVFWGFNVEKLRKPATPVEFKKLDAFLNDIKIIEDNVRKTILCKDGWQHSYLVANAIARRNLHDLGEAFKFLAEIIQKERAVLDLYTEGNVLFDSEGRLCLADPIALEWAEEWQKEDLKVDWDSSRVSKPLEDSPFKLSLA